MSKVGFRHSWRKMEMAWQNGAGWRQVESEEGATGRDKAEVNVGNALASKGRYVSFR